MEYWVFRRSRKRHEKTRSFSSDTGAKRNPKIPNIYKIPINEFLGQDFPWNRTEEGEVRFYEEEKIESITVDEIRAQISWNLVNY